MGKSFTLLVGVQSSAPILEIDLEVSQNSGNRITTWPSYTGSEYRPKDFCIILHRYLHIHFHFWSIHNSWEIESTRCLPTDEWIVKMWYIDMEEYYSTIKKCEIIKFARKWMALENRLKTHKPKRQMPHVLSHMWTLASNFVSCVFGLEYTWK